MATTPENYRDQDFESAFREEAPPQGGAGDDFGIVPSTKEGEGADAAPAAADAAETATPAEGTPAAVVVVAEVDDAAAAASEEAAANEAAAAEAKRVNDEHNAAAANNKSATPSTASNETGNETGADATKPVVAEEEEQTTEPAENVAAAVEEEPVDPKDIQRKKSWEGRLRAEEKRLKDLAAKLGTQPAAGAEGEEGGDQATADAIGEAADKAKASGDSTAAEQLDAVAAQVESGELTVEEAMKTIAEDFGDGFVRMISAVASDAATKAVSSRLGKLEEDTEGVISQLRNSEERRHFEAIHTAHPDFVEVSEEPGFAQFVQAQGKQEVAEKGSAREINKLLADYKASRQAAPEEKPAPTTAAATPAQDAVAAADEVDEGAADAAEGVRSAGMRIPERPNRASDDFATAWKEF